MGEMTSDTPKPMLPVQGKPMLEHVLDRLATAGVERFLVVVGYRRELILEHFRNWEHPIEFRVQETIDGTGSATRLAEDFTGDAPFFLTFGDILCEPATYVRAGQVLQGHPGTVAVMGVRDVDDPWRGAAVYEEAGRITRVIEKPPQGTSTTRWNSGGVFVLTRAVYDYLAKLRPSVRNEYELTAALDEMLADGLELRISSIEGDWSDVGRPEDLAAANSSPELLSDAD
jgi:NDP-sugar pyrophosphorylase family protein